MTAVVVTAVRVAAVGVAAKEITLNSKRSQTMDLPFPAACLLWKIYIGTNLGFDNVGVYFILI